jgi:hypothetical protein
MDIQPPKKATITQSKQCAMEDQLSVFFHLVYVIRHQVDDASESFSSVGLEPTNNSSTCHPLGHVAPRKNGTGAQLLATESLLVSPNSGYLFHPSA